MIIRSRAPLRLGLAGGGTDVSPFCDIHGGLVLNATIDRYAYANIKILDSTKELRFIAADQKTSKSINVAEEVKLTGELDLHTAIYSYMIKNFNSNIHIPMEITTFCDAPMGSGLGSSSTLVVAIVKAFVELLNLSLDDYQIANLAYKIERIDCLLAGGRQDQYSATFGGFNFMEFYANEKAVINSLRIKNWILCELEASLLLFFTGISRESANIIKDQSENIEAGSLKALSAMHGLKQEAITMKESLLRGDFSDFVESMERGWENKKNSASSVSNAYIEKIYDAAKNAGALAGKISGAGGGGFMLFFVPAESRMKVIDTLSQFNGQTSNCHFTASGCQAWRID
jgi:D-glycero-alpha-D-manno-heptose-7-phosphate kinase